jgi:hypothetical protein
MASWGEPRNLGSHFEFEDCARKDLSKMANQLELVNTEPRYSFFTLSDSDKHPHITQLLNVFTVTYNDYTLRIYVLCDSLKRRARHRPLLTPKRGTACVVNERWIVKPGTNVTVRPHDVPRPPP